MVQILEGIATVAVGILAAFMLFDYPATAAFLTPEERAYIIWKKSGCFVLVGFLDSLHVFAVFSWFFFCLLHLPFNVLWDRI